LFLTHWVEASEEFALPSQPHEYWRWLDHTTTYSEFKKEMWVKKILEKARFRNLEVKTDMAVGHPAEQIIHRAEADGIDLIILGRRGRSMISRMMLGSVSERALRYAHCPVMVVH